MPFLIQHGWGTGSGDDDKIRRALQHGIASGVIFGPDTVRPDPLERYVRQLRADHSDIEIFIDPQVYVATIDNANYKRLVDYQDKYFEINLDRQSFRPRFIQHLVRRTFGWQLANRVSGIISPGVQVQGFGSDWARIAMLLAQESCDYKQEQEIEIPLYVTIAVSEESFQDFQLMNEFLDELTNLEVDGFYLLIFQRGSEYRRSVDLAALSNILHFIYSLGEVNEFPVIVGYADLNGYLYRTVGASHFASGWSHNLRRLTEDRWSAGAGGARPRPRYTSLQLMNTILINPELRRIFEEGQILRVIHNSQFDRVFSGNRRPQSITWPETSYHMQYLFVCSELERSIRQGNLSQRCRRARSTIAGATRLYSALIDNHHVEFSPESGSRHLSVWQVGLQEFCARVGISL
jgi:hypothetical protein